MKIYAASLVEINEAIKNYIKKRYTISKGFFVNFNETDPDCGKRQVHLKLKNNKKIEFVNIIFEMPLDGRNEIAFENVLTGVWEC